MEENAYTPGVIDKFASTMIKIFLDPFRKIFSNVKSKQKSGSIKTTDEISNQINNKTTPTNTLEEKAIAIDKTSRFPKLPSGIPTKKIILGIGVLVFVLVTLNLVLGVLRREPSFTGPTTLPTVAVIEPSEPSIYAKDEEVLALEESINVLDRELTNAALKDTSLRPPTLDFIISF